MTCAEQHMTYVGPLKRINFTQEERMRLISLVEKHKDILMSRNSEVSTRQKGDAWKMITEEFNQNCELICNRDMRQLRKCWENMKTRFRKSNPDCSDAQVGILQEHEHTGALLSMYSEMGPNSLTPQLNQRMNNVMGDHASRSSSTGGIPPTFVDSILHRVQTSMSEDPKNHQLLKTELSPSSSIDYTSREQGPTSPEVLFFEGSGGRMVAPSDAAMTSSSTAVTSFGETQKRKSAPNRFSGLSMVKRRRFSEEAPTDQSRTSLATISQSYAVGDKTGQSHADSTPNGQSHARAAQGVQSRTWGGGRGTSGGGERNLRVRLMKSRIREHEMRTREIQQRMRHATERHAALMSLLTRRATFYEEQGARMSEALNGGEEGDVLEDEVEEDLMWEAMH